MNSIFSSIVFLLIFASLARAGDVERYVSISIDDLPVVTKQKGIEAKRSITNRILKHIKAFNAPTIGFVNENKLYTDGEKNPDQVGLLKQWLEAGCDLGNHTYSHIRLHGNELDSYTAEILQGEVVTKALLRNYNKEIEYFRHPFLNTGRSLEVKVKLQHFLTQHKYKIAPVSLDNSDWAFAAAYDNAILKKDNKLKLRIGKAYVPYLRAKTEYWEIQSVKLFDREIKQILLLHANSINADYLDDVLEMFQARNYRFITMKDALTDRAYEKPDTFVGSAGISWLHRWALEKGKEYVLPNEPRVPKFVMEAAGLTSE